MHISARFHRQPYSERKERKREREVREREREKMGDASEIAHFPSLVTVFLDEYNRVDGM